MRRLDSEMYLATNCELGVIRQGFNKKLTPQAFYLNPIRVCAHKRTVDTGFCQSPAYRVGLYSLSDTMLPPIGCIVIFIFPSLPTFVFLTADLGQKLFLSAVS